MENYVSKFMVDSDFGLIMAQMSSSITAAKPFSIGLDASQRKGLRSMAEGREGITRTISRISLEHVDNLPRTEDPLVLETLLAYYDKLAGMRERAAHMHEMLDDTAVGLSVDIMKMADRFNAHLQAARTGNANLDAALIQIDEYNKRFGTRPNAEETDTPVVE
jgi:hypothetical protein